MARQISENEFVLKVKEKVFGEEAEEPCDLGLLLEHTVRCIDIAYKLHELVPDPKRNSKEGMTECLEGARGGVE